MNSQIDKEYLSIILGFIHFSFVFCMLPSVPGIEFAAEKLIFDCLVRGKE